MKIYGNRNLYEEVQGSVCNFWKLNAYISNWVCEKYKPVWLLIN